MADRKLIPRIVTWAAFYEALTLEFQPINTTKIARDKLAELRQRNSVQAYVFEFRNVVAEVPNMSEEEKVDKFIRGLKEKTRQEVDIRDPKSLEEAIRIADRYDTISFQNHRKAIPKYPVNNNNTTPMDIDNIGVNERKHTTVRKEGPGPCFICGKVGHFKNQCPSRRKTFVKGNSQ